MNEKTEDRDLLVKFQRGDRDAFLEFYQRHKNGIARYFRALIGDEEAARDLFQELFRSLIENPSPFVDAENSRNYLYGAARRLALREMRNVSRRRKRLEIKAASLFSAVSDGPGEESFGTEELAKLGPALMRLENNLRELILLHALEGLSFRDIESLTGVSKSQLARDYEKALLQLETELR